MRKTVPGTKCSHVLYVLFSPGVVQSAAGKKNEEEEERRRMKEEEERRTKEEEERLQQEPVSLFTSVSYRPVRFQ